ncbi:sensor histidine kinase [Janthinobacterium sp.]|uniref:sensor histidine kinase n=1 Tax=Janthinobacterium sp. TaxID=1871054 RepID=UPI003977A5BC
MEDILQEWEDFAKTMNSTVHGMNSRELRDHAEAMLRVIAKDLETAQNKQASIDKSQGLAPEVNADTAAEIHAADRLASGFTIEQLMAEYRALRASVLRLWKERIETISSCEIEDMVRFNEAIDQALTESIARYSAMFRESQNLFLAILGHDVRSPLGAISMGAQVLLRDDTLSAKSLKVASRILNSTGRVTEIVSDLLDFATSHLGDGIPVSPAAMNFAKVCDAVIEEARAFHPDRMIELASTGDMHAVWDSARISQAFSNLLANAIQHGSQTDPISIAVSGEKEDIVWTIRNTGEVITAANRRTIFDPAKRFALRPASERSLGHPQNLGLGLYITRDIVSAHGGHISITSTKEEGTTFTVRLPRKMHDKSA